MVRFYVFDELTRPHQIETSIGGVRSLCEIVESMCVENLAIAFGLGAAVHPLYFTAQVFKKSCTVAFTTSDV